MDALRKIADLIRDPNVQIDTWTFVLAILISLCVAIFIAILYQIFYENRATGSQIHRSFVLLGPSITALFVAIQWSLPLSLGLLGALSIIRFRTPIKEPEEIGFIMLLIACSVVIATFQLLLLVTLLAVTILGLVIKHNISVLNPSSRKDGIVLVSFGTTDGNDAFEEISRLLSEMLPKAKLESISEVEGITNLHYSFCDLTSDTAISLRQRLAKVDQINGVNMYFNKSSSLL